MTDDDVTVVPTRPRTDRPGGQSVEATYHETQAQSRQRDARRCPESSESPGDDHSDRGLAPHRISRTTIGVIAFLLGAATLLYGVAAGLGGVQQTLDSTVFGSLLDSDSLVVTVAVTRTVALGFLALGTLGIGSIVARAALTVIARS
jgi:hypothetical protein